MVSKGNPSKYTAQLENRDGGNYTKTLKRDDFTCQKCNSILDLIVHHKDKNNKNNKLENLITLCRFCHAKEHWSKIKFDKPPIDIINEIRNQGYTYAYIAQYLGVSRQRVHQIIKRKIIA